MAIAREAIEARRRRGRASTHDPRTIGSSSSRVPVAAGAPRGHPAGRRRARSTLLARAVWLPTAAAAWSSRGSCSAAGSRSPATARSSSGRSRLGPRPRVVGSTSAPTSTGSRRNWRRPRPPPRPRGRPHAAADARRGARAPTWPGAGAEANAAAARRRAEDSIERAASPPRPRAGTPPGWPRRPSASRPRRRGSRRHLPEEVADDAGG